MTDDRSDIRIVAILAGGPDDDHADVEQGVIDVNRELRAIGTLHPAPTVTAPAGTRGGDPAMIGGICASLAPTVPDLIAALRALLTWAGRRTGRTATVVRPDGSRIELTGLSEGDQHALVQDWIDGNRAK